MEHRWLWIAGFPKDRQALYVMTESSEGEAAVKRYALGGNNIWGWIIHSHRAYIFHKKKEQKSSLPLHKDWNGQLVIPLMIIADFLTARCS